MFSFLRSFHIVFPKWLHWLAIPKVVYEGSFFPTSSPTPVVGGIFADSYSNRGEMESQCGFDLHFLYGQRW
jgi:hypothetical protein